MSHQVYLHGFNAQSAAPGDGYTSVGGSDLGSAFLEQGLTYKPIRR
jgi:hypothetical protein